MSKFVGTGPSSYEKSIYRAAVSQRLRNTSIVSTKTGYWLDGPGIKFRWGARFSVHVQTGPGAHPASCTIGTRSFPGVKSGLGVMLTPHPLLVPRSKKSRAIPLLPLWTVQPVQNLSACTRVHFTLSKYMKYGHWVLVSHTQDKWWLQIKAVSNEQPLKCPPPLQNSPGRGIN